MRKYGKWLLTLGLVAATPSVSLAGLFGQDSGPTSAATQPARRTNQQVTEEIASALRSAKLAGYEIEIGYRNGVATLKGKIADTRQKEQATRIVAGIDGVKSVRNDMTVMASPQPATRPAPAGAIQQVNYTASPAQQNQQVAEQVAGALREAQLDGYDIEIRYENGTALLSGQVGDAQQWSRATQAASRVPGVNRVDNRLQVPGGARPAAAPQAGLPVSPAAYQQGAPYQPQPVSYQGPGGEGMVAPAMAGPGGMSAQPVYNVPNLPEHAWPTYAAYPNYAGVTYPSQYSASAFPYIGPFYPYPQVPLGWRSAQLEWDDGMWNLNFNPRTEKWWWFLNPHNW